MRRQYTNMFQKIKTYTELIKYLKEEANTPSKHSDLMIYAANAIENLLKEERTYLGMRSK